jgi:cobalamin biosynthesis Co2+ chelatase CbiK
MSAIVLSIKGSKLIRVCEVEGFATVDDLIALVVADSVCPAICMTAGCEHIAPMESDQEEGYCEMCGGNTMVSVLVLAGLI